MTENVTIVQKKKAFDIKAGIQLPLKISKYKIDHSYLFIAPEKASFITTGEIGSQFLSYFKEGYSIERVIDKMKNNGFNMDMIISELHSFLVKLEKKGFYEDSAVKNINISQPSLHLDLTTRCNLTCVHCLRDAGKGQPEELTTGDWLKVIDTFSSLNKTRVCFSGGEAMLHPGIFDILKRAKDRGLYVILFTNGTLIDSQRVANKLEKIVDKIQVSLDGATAEVNDKIRGKGCFEKVFRAVHFLEKTRINLDIAISVMPQNSDDLEQNLEKLAKMLGPKVNIRVSPSVKEGRATASHTFSSQEVGRGKIRKLTGLIYQKRLKAMTKEEKNVKLNNCGYGETVVVSSIGDIFPCNLYEPRVKFGNVRNDDFAKILKEIDNARKLVDVENIEKCKTCDLKIICYGGCRLNNIYRNNDIAKPACTPEYKKQLCARIVEREENFDPLALWLGEDETESKRFDN